MIHDTEILFGWDTDHGGRIYFIQFSIGIAVAFVSKLTFFHRLFSLLKGIKNRVGFSYCF